MQEIKHGAAQQSLNQALEEENKEKYFASPFMEPGATSESYLESVVQDVPLEQIRRVVDSCYFDE